MRKFFVGILVFPLLCGLSLSAFADWIVDFDSFPEKAERLHYLISHDDALDQLLSIENTKPGLIIESIDLTKDVESWDMYNYYYSDRDKKVYCASISIISYSNMIYPHKLVYEAYSPDDFLTLINKSYYAITKTREWELENGPYQSWSVTKKAEFFAEYNISATGEFQTRFDSWSIPDSKNITEDEARHYVNEVIGREYNSSLDKMKSLIEDVRYVWTPEANVGRWEFRYWVKVRKDHRIYWSTIATVRQGYTKEDYSEFKFYLDNGVDPEYLDYFMP